MATSISPKGQLTIKKSIRQELGIEAGDKFEMEFDYEIGAIVIYPLKEEEKITPEQAIKKLCGILKDSNILEEYLAEKHAEIEKEKQELERFLKSKKRLK